jgi:TonB family protein
MMNILFSKITSVMLAAALMPLPVGMITGAVGAQELPSTSAASCEVPNAPATTAYAAPAERPSIAAMYDLSGVTSVKVDIDQAGAVVSTSVAKSSGIPMLDQAAVAAARASTFRPEIRDCAPIAGSYLFMVDFSG